MAGRREQQKEARRRAILRAATRLFERRGYAATSIEDIAAGAELAVGTIYNYFPSKPEILMALIRADTSQVLEAGEAIVKDPPDDPADAVAELLEAYAALAVQHDRRLWRELFAAVVAGPDALGLELLGEDLRLVAQLVALLEEFRARGVLDGSFETSRAATTLYAVFITWCVTYSVAASVSADQLRQEIRTGVALVIDGLRARALEGDKP